MDLIETITASDAEYGALSRDASTTIQAPDLQPVSFAIRH